MESSKTNTVANIGRNDPEVIAREMGMTDIEPRRPASPEARRNVLGLAAGVGTVAVAALALLPRGDHAPAPVPESFEKQVQDSARQPYDPATDEIVIDGIRIKPGNPHMNTKSEAVFGNTEVQGLLVDNPDEEESLVASANTPPASETDTIVVVKRDFDNDGDSDLLAVSR